MSRLAGLCDFTHKEGNNKLLLADVGHQDRFVPIHWDAVLSCGPCPCCSAYMGELGASHGGQTCDAAPLSIMMSTLVSSCWTD